MKITAVETVRPAETPNVCLVVLHTDGTEVGIGETFFGAGPVEAYIHDTAAPALLEADDANPEAVARLLRPYAGYASSGAETRGNSAIDIAMWDLLGQRAGLPVAELLGGPVRRSVPIYNTCAGYGYVSQESRQRMANWGLPAADAEGRPYEDLDAFLHRPGELAASLLDEGVTAMKVWPFDSAAESSGGTRITPSQMAQGLSVLDRIKGAVGDRMEIMVELHGLWNLASARRICAALADYEPFWVEDPLRPDNVEGYRRLKETAGVSLAVGETLAGTRGFHPLLSTGAIDVAIVDLGWAGGITAARNIASLADVYGVAFAPHDCTGPVAFAACTHLVASQPNGLVQETVRAFRSDWYRRLAVGGPQVDGGEVHLGAAPGLGVSLADGLRQRSSVRVSRR